MFVAWLFCENELSLKNKLSMVHTDHATAGLDPKEEQVLNTLTTPPKTHVLVCTTNFSSYVQLTDLCCKFMLKI